MKFTDYSAEDLIKLGRERQEKYINAAPYSHASFDNLFTEAVLNQILEEFPSLEKEKDINYNTANAKKLASKGEYRFGEKTKNFLHFLNSQPFLEFLSELTGIKNLIPDPYFVGGGLHEIKTGGFLKIHADFNKHPMMDLDRRLNVLVYLNKDWEEVFGGSFELWNRNMSKCEAKFLPVYNRMVVFSTTDFSYHGHPDPLTCPTDRSRRSLALYYYTNGRPKNEINAGLEKHTTIFKMRKEAASDKNREFTPKERFDRIKYYAKRFIPPIIFDVVRKKER